MNYTEINPYHGEVARAVHYLYLINSSTLSSSRTPYFVYLSFISKGHAPLPHPSNYSSWFANSYTILSFK